MKPDADAITPISQGTYKFTALLIVNDSLENPFTSNAAFCDEFLLGQPDPVVGGLTGTALAVIAIIFFFLNKINNH